MKKAPRLPRERPLFLMAVFLAVFFTLICSYGFAGELWRADDPRTANPINRYYPENPLNPVNLFRPDNNFNPVNRFNPDNPLNAINRYDPNNLLNPINRYKTDSTLNPINRFRSPYDDPRRR